MMIVKMRQPLEWERFDCKTHEVLAIKMTEDFLYETPTGFINGFIGQWLIEHGENMRRAIDDEAFQRQYSRVKENHAE